MILQAGEIVTLVELYVCPLPYVHVQWNMVLVIFDVLQLSVSGNESSWIAMRVPSSIIELDITDN